MKPLFPRVQSLAFGFSLPLRALRLIASSPALIALSLLPVAVTLAIYGFVIARAQEWARGWLSAQLASHGVAPEGILAALVAFLVWVILLIAAALTFSLVAGVAASPFNDFLAEKAEPLSVPMLPPAAPTSLLAKLKLVLIDLGKTLAAGMMSLVALLFSWVPVVNVVAFALAFLLVTFQFVSYPQTRRGEGVGQGLRFLASHPFACLGFGAACSGLFAVPLVSSLALPLAVVGGTLLYARAKVEPSERFPRLR